MIVVTCCLRNAETIIFGDGTCCWYWVGLHLQPSSPAGRGGWLFGGHNEDFDLGFFGVGLGDRSGSISLSLYFSAHACSGTPCHCPCVPNPYVWEYRVGQPKRLESTASAAADSCTKSARSGAQPRPNTLLTPKTNAAQSVVRWPLVAGDARRRPR